MIKLKRDDNQYLEIEEFKDYELTQCITYEFAIRTEILKNKIDEVVKFYDDNEHCINAYLEQDNVKYNTIAYLSKNIEEYNFELYSKAINVFHKLNRMIDNIDIFHEYSYLNLVDKPYKRIDLFGEKIYNILEVLIKYHLGNKIVIGEKQNTNKIEFEHDKICDVVRISKITEREGYLIHTYIIKSDEECYYYNEEDNGKMVENIEEFKSLGYDNLNIKENIGIKIEENFQRPKIEPSPLFSKNVSLQIDINKPLDEILAYIRHVKIDIEINEKILKAPLELLGEELKKADNLICDDKGNCFDVRTILSKQQKLADMFYIYDCLKLGYTQRKIQNEIYNYYADKGIETVTMDAKTLKKYKEIAVDYIDNLRYKELITGIKIEDLEKEEF